LQFRFGDHSLDSNRRELRRGGELMAFGAMVALARRAKVGGSWLVRISLAQTGKWLVDRGEVPAAALKDVPKEFPQADIDRW
jgi:hypothetical protein